MQYNKIKSLVSKIYSKICNIMYWKIYDYNWIFKIYIKNKKPKNKDFVNIKRYIPNIKYDIKYATTDNFTHKQIYKSPEENLKLQYQAIKRLKKAEKYANQQWLFLKIWDAYRPDDAQIVLRDYYDEIWLPARLKSKLVAKPIKLWWKWSKHLLGEAIDLTLVDKNWNELEMPTKFDEFWNKTSWNYVNKLTQNNIKRENALKLKAIMEKAGFKTLKSERWHFESKT